MISNPDQPGEASSKTRATRWMVSVGVTAILLAGVCLLVTVVGLVLSANSITAANIGDPTELADSMDRIRIAAFPAMASGPLFVVGLVFLILGFIRREPVS